MAPVGAGDEAPAVGPDISSAGAFGIAHVAGGGDEGLELGVGNLVACDAERCDRDRARRFIGIAFGITHDEPAARYVDQIAGARRCVAHDDRVDDYK